MRVFNFKCHDFEPSIGDPSMKFECRTKIVIVLAALFLTFGLVQPQFTPAQEAAQQAKPKAKQRGGFMRMQADPRVQTRTYIFKETNEEMQYMLFVSSKVSKDKKAPLIVTLHGLGVGPVFMMGTEAVDLAEEGGYILVGPMGYNERGWFGIPMGQKKGSSKTTPKPKNKTAEAKPDIGAAPKLKDQTSEAKPDTSAKPKPMMSMFSNANDPPNLRELSEKDVMNVLDIVRKEFNVDENRIYLMGHSMGGAGTLYLGVKYASIWAALAPVAPAAFGLNPDSLAEIKDMPVIFVHGDADEMVPVANTRRWVEKAKELNMTYEYNEMPGISHGPVINASLPSVYEFFGKHSKPATR
jgi:poly(3-hydroxybutyrate) depolymerase